MGRSGSDVNYYFIVLDLKLFCEFLYVSKELNFDKILELSPANFN